MTTHTHQLASCPFCGDKAHSGKEIGKIWFIKCLNSQCGAMVHGYGNIDAAMKSWNRRATPPPASTGAGDADAQLAVARNHIHRLLLCHYTNVETEAHDVASAHDFWRRTANPTGLALADAIIASGMSDGTQPPTSDARAVADSHTAEPWECGGTALVANNKAALEELFVRQFKESLAAHQGENLGEYVMEIYKPGGLRVAFMAGPTAVENAYRIVSCVNALTGLSQDALDGGWTYRGIEDYVQWCEKRIKEFESQAPAQPEAVAIVQDTFYDEENEFWVGSIQFTGNRLPLFTKLWNTPAQPEADRWVPPAEGRLSKEQVGQLRNGLDSLRSFMSETQAFAITRAVDVIHDLYQIAQRAPNTTPPKPGEDAELRELKLRINELALVHSDDDGALSESSFAQLNSLANTILNLRIDAGRYRWLRSGDLPWNHHQPAAYLGGEFCLDADLDAAIDAAIALTTTQQAATKDGA